MKRLILTTGILACLMPCTKAQVEPPTMGWSSWNTFAVNISEDIIKGQADAMVSQGLKDVGYLYINIDDGFQYGRLSNGKVRIHPTRFPRGLKPVSDYIHAKGLKAGIYSDAGDCTCGSIYNGDTRNTDVGFYGHEQTDADYYFKELEFDFIKVDYCGGNHAGLNEQEQYTAIHDAIAATGRNVRYNLCRWAYPGTWCHDISTSWRTTGDIYDGWASVKGIIDENLYLSAYCYDGCYNDMDMLEVGRSMTEEEDKTHFGMWCIMSSPLLIGCNMATLRERPLALLKNTELIALNQDPLGLQAYVVQHRGETYVLIKDILTLHGLTRAVALYNPSDKEVQMTVSFSELDLAGKVKVRDLYSHQDLGELEGALSTLVPPHATRIYKLEAERRLDRYSYEGETAFLHDYQEIYNNQSAETAIYERSSAASGGAYASWLGRRRSNSLEWKDVYVSEEGDYTAHFTTASKDKRTFSVVLNGEEQGSISVQTTDWQAFKDYDITLHLHAGSNSILLYNDSDWMPNIDRLTIEKTGESSVLNRQLEEATERLRAMNEDESLTERLHQNIEALLAKAEKEGLTDNELRSLLAEAQSLQTSVEQVLPVCKEYLFWRAYAEKNVAASLESTALSSFVSRINRCDSSFDKAYTLTAINSALSSLKTGITSYLKSATAMPKEGEHLDMTILIANYDFSSSDGWEGQPTYRSGCGEAYNKTFDIYQTLPNMRVGIYTVTCNALFRPKGNDGGTAYKSGTENITALFYAGDQSVKVKSLYSEDWPEASGYGSVDNLNGYPHSMYAAGIRFAEGCYPNEVTCTLTDKGTLRFGLKCDTYKAESWCCFDNFALSYKAPTDFYDGIKDTRHSPLTIDQSWFDLQGRKLPSRAHQRTSGTEQTGIVIHNGRKIAVKR